MVYVITFMVRPEAYEGDLALAAACLQSLAACPEPIVVAYNEGCLTNDEVTRLFARHGLRHTVVLGAGENVGIAAGRQAAFEHIWTDLPREPYVCELHLDMVLYPGWERPLLEVLEATDEPMLGPGVVDASGRIHPWVWVDAAGALWLFDANESPVSFPKPGGLGDSPSVETGGRARSADVAELMRWLATFSKDEMREGYNNPCVYKADALRAVGGYDTRFLRGRQEFEDTSLMIGLIYYMGTRVKWAPKSCLRTFVYHGVEGQRVGMAGAGAEVERNFAGLCRQYGAYGLLELLKRNPSHARYNHWFKEIQEGRFPAE